MFDALPTDIVPVVTKSSSSNDMVPLSSSIAISPLAIFKFAIEAVSSTFKLIKFPTPGLFKPIATPSISPPSILIFSRF